MKILKVILVAVFLVTGGAVTAQTQTVAHRGYWKAPGAAQNSIAALGSALEIGCAGSELDVIMTKDGVLVLHHNDLLDGTDHRVDDCLYSEIKDLKLSNGEVIPTLDQYVAVAREQKKNRSAPNIVQGSGKVGASEFTKLIIEIKPHETKEKEDAAVKAVVDLIKRTKMGQKVEYISFSRNICSQLIALSPKAKVAYLGSDLTPREVKDMGLTGIDYHIGAMRAHEEWFGQARDLGLEINVWTVNDKENMQYLIDKQVDYITTDEPEMLQRLLME